jgi:hypothetical protein
MIKDISILYTFLGKECYQKTKNTLFMKNRYQKLDLYI